jgi:hypothetical protein
MWIVSFGVVSCFVSSMVYCFNGLNGAVEWSRSLVHQLYRFATGRADVGDEKPSGARTFYGNVFCLSGGWYQWQRNLGQTAT